MSATATTGRASIEAIPLVPHEQTDWSRVKRSTYVIRQHLRYEYPAPISALRQRLMIVPPSRHGDQRCTAWWVDVSQPARRHDRRDRFGNRVISLDVGRVDDAIEFDSCIAVERRSTPRPHRVPIDATLAQTTPLTTPDPQLAEAARELRGRHPHRATRAEEVCAWVHDHLAYRFGVTAVHTTAAEALAGGLGVCQDYAHIMLAVCRQAGLPARYISGHLLGEGGSHAWVEVLLPDPDRVSGWAAMALDPTHNTAAGLNYVTIAAGRDYSDVAPTSGTYRATSIGSLHARKRVGLVAVEHRTSPAPSGSA